MVLSLTAYSSVGCADEGGALFAIDALRTSAHPTALKQASCRRTKQPQFTNGVVPT